MKSYTIFSPYFPKMSCDTPPIVKMFQKPNDAKCPLLWGVLDIFKNFSCEKCKNKIVKNLADSYKIPNFAASTRKYMYHKSITHTIKTQKMNVKLITQNTQTAIFKKSGILVCILMAFLFCTNTFAATITWKANSNSNWNSPSNWQGGPVPTFGDIAVFDATSAFNCNIDANVNVAGIQINAGYTGTITQNGYTITCGASGFTQSTGTFTGGTAAITGNGAFNLSGGIFTSTSGVFTQTSTFTNSGGTFNHNNGSVVFSGGLTITGSTTFYDLSFTGSGVTYTIGSSTTLTANNTFNTTGASYATLSGGTIDVKGNINVNNTYAANNNHSTSVTITGTGSQTFTGAITAYQGRFPSVTINKASGTLYLKNNITFEGNFTYTTGTIDYTTNTNRLIFISNGKTITVNAVLTVGDVEFYGTGSNYTLTTPSNFNVTGTLYISGSSYGTMLSGTIYAQGNITVTNSYTANMGHTAIITINGSGNQNLSGTITAMQGRLPSLVIAKGGGTLYLLNYITTEGHYSYFMGTVDYTTNANRVIFISNGKTILTNTAHTLGDVEFVGTGSSYTLTTTGAFNIAGTLYISGTSYGTMYTGTINAKGNITVTNSYTANMGHTAIINITGTANQNFTGPTTSLQGRLASIIINKASGTLYLLNYITTEGNWTYTTGTIDYTTNANRVIFISNGKTITTNAVHTLGDVEFVGTGSSFTFTTPSAFNIAGTLYFSGTSYGTMLSGTINPQGNINVSNSYTANMGHTATWNINGTSNQNFTGTTTIYQGRVPSIIINKASGTLYLINYITDEGNWTYTTGTVDYTTSANRVIFISNGKTITTNAVHTLGDVEFNGTGSNTTWTTPSAFNITGTMFITGNSYGTFLGGTVNSQGNIAVTNSYTANMGHTATININGTSNQNFTGTTTIYQGRVPSIVINKASGTLYLINYITDEGNWTYATGTVNYTNNANRIIFISNGKTITTNAVHTLGDVEFYGTGSNTTWTTNSTFNIAGTMYITGNSYGTFLGGSVNSQGNITVTNSYTANMNHTATISINGTANQNFTGTTTIYQGRLPSIIINKASGTLYLINYITDECNWTYTTGTVDYTTNANRVIFIGNGKTITTNAVHTLGDVEFYGTGSNTKWTTSFTFNIAGTMYITGNSYGTFLGGTVNSQGNITVTNSYTSNMNHTATININGTANQNFTGTTTIYQGRLPNIIINKASGTLYLINYITAECNWTYTTGTVDYTSSANRVIFIANGKTITKNANHTIGDAEFYGTGSNTTFTTPSAFNVAGTMYITGNSYGTMLTGTVNAQGNITVSNSYTANNNHTATININGSANQLFTGQGTAGTGRLPNITINKTGGTLTLAAPIITAEGNWSYTAGTMDVATDTSSVAFYNSGKYISGALYTATLMDNNRRTLNGAMSISNVLALGTGNLDLNQNTLSILNSAAGAITYSTGYIKSEQTDNSSKIAWTIGSNTGSHVYPFGTNGGSLIPFTFTVTAGDVGAFSVATYSTNSTCKPYPVTPDSVLHVRNVAGFDNSSNTVKRFWQLTKGGVSGTANMTFTAAAAEVGTITSLRAQRYNKINNGWDQPIGGQSNPTAYSATVSGVSTFSPWTMSGNGVPLPIQLVDFTGNYVKETKSVHTQWTTASEVNSNYFTIQRSANGVDFDSIGAVQGAGNSNALLNYSFDDMNPLQGISYYRLSQTDFDGKVATFNMILIDVNTDENTTVNIFPNPGNGTEVNVVYTDEAEGDNITFTIADIAGKTIAQTTIVNEAKGMNIYKFTPPSTLPSGIYFMTAVINNKSFSKKIIVQ